MLALAALIAAALVCGALFQTLLAGPRGAALQSALVALGGIGAITAWFRYQSNYFWLAGGIALVASLVLWIPALRGTDTKRLQILRIVLSLIATALIARGILP